MRHTSLVATLLSTGLLFSAGQAVAESWTIGGNVGYAMGDASAGAINRQLSDLGLNATATNNVESRRAWQVYLGYQHTPEVGFEVGYVNLGQVTTTLSGTTDDINTFLTSVEDIHPQTANGWQATASYRYPVDKTSNVIVKAGLLDWVNRYTLETTTVSRTVNNTGASGVVGLGFETELATNVLLSANVSHYRISGEPVSITDLGILYKFD